MTPQELAEIDQKVAEAIGGIEGKCQWLFPWGGMATVSTPESHNPEYADEVAEVWRPSACWNDAMLAAEKAGLLEHGILIQPGTVVIHDQWGEQIYHADAESGQLALCEAVINMKGKA